MQYLLRGKITYILACFFCFPLIGFTQFREELNQPDHDQKRFHFGINLGFNRSHYSFTFHPLFRQQDSVMWVESINSSGINLAWLVNMNISEHLDIRTYPLDLIFTEKAFQYRLSYPDRPAGEDSVTLKKVQSISMTLPIQVKFSSDRIGNFKVYMLAGVKAEYDFAANAGKKNSESILKLNPFDYGIQAGLGFHFYYPYFVLTPELKVDYGLSNLHSRDPNNKFSNVIDKIYSRMISFSLTVE